MVWGGGAPTKSRKASRPAFQMHAGTGTFREGPGFKTMGWLMLSLNKQLVKE